MTMAPGPDGSKRAAARPCLAVLPGDPAGIGPELAVKLLAQPRTLEAADVVVIGDPRVLDAGSRIAGIDLQRHPIPALERVSIVPGRINLFAVPLPGAALPRTGTSSVEAGAAVLDALRTAADAARRGAIDAILFAPLNKHAMRLAGLEHEDELRYLQALLDVRSFVTEFNVTNGLWTSRVTSHIPLKDVAAAITVDGVCAAVRILDDNLRAAGIGAPRIAVAGLNPHAGDGGNYGDEEIRIIAPAVATMRERGANVTGPMPADTVFVAARRGDYDAVVSMYHDQGQIAMKLMGFERGVTLLGGLPIPVTTCASGTAFDIAGKGIANAVGLQQAFEIATRMAAARTSTRHDDARSP
jgi:4-hydroxythreonine-4-phosphate dehydrogenase